jgi:hypothetical protein
MIAHCKEIEIVYIRSVHLLLVTADVPSSLILVTLMMETTRSSEMLALTRATQRNIPQDGILHFQGVDECFPKAILLSLLL